MRKKQVARSDYSTVLLGPDCHSLPVAAMHPEEIVAPKNAATGEMNNGRMVPTASLRILQEGVEISQDA